MYWRTQHFPFHRPRSQGDLEDPLLGTGGLGRYDPGLRAVHREATVIVDQVPKDEAGRGRFITEQFKRRNAAVANQYRDKLIELYGRRQGSAFRYAEAFELCEYGSQPSIEELKKLFPSF